MILFLLIPLMVIAFSWIDAQHLDAFQWFKDHKSRAISRMLIITIIACLNLYIGLYTLFCFYGLFDFSLNIIRRDVEWDHIGSYAKMDKILKKIKWFYFSSKLSTLFMCVLMVIVYKNEVVINIIKDLFIYKFMVKYLCFR